MNNNFFEKNKAILDEIKAKSLNRIKKLGEPLDDPVLSPETYPFIFLANRDPTDDEPDVYHGYAGLILMWENTTSGDFFISPDNTAIPLVWNKITSDANLLAMLNTLGWQINTDRGRNTRSSPAFNTAYTPSVTNDTEVIATVSMQAPLLGTALIQVQVNSGSGYDIVGHESTTDSVNTLNRMLTFIVPADASYQIMAAGGTTSIVSIKELSQ